MKIRINDHAERQGFTKEEASRITDGIDKRFPGRWVSTEIAIFIVDFGSELTVEITGDTPKNGPQQFELHLSRGMLNDMADHRDRIVQTIGECAVSCMRRDLDWLVDVDTGGRSAVHGPVFATAMPQADLVYRFYLPIALR